MPSLGAYAPEILERIVRQISTPVLVDDRAGSLLLCNAAAAGLLREAGLLCETGTPLAGLLCEWHRRVATTDAGLACARWLQQGARTPLAVPAAHGGHHELHREALAGLGWLWTIHDVGKHQRIEAALRATAEVLEQHVRERSRALDEAQRAAQAAHLSKTRFFAAASHDLLQPLNAARIFASSLAELPDLPDSARQVAARIDAALRNAEDVIDVLVDVAKLDTGAVRPHFEEFDLDDLLRGLVDQFDSLSRGRRLRLQLGPCSIRVRSDRRLLRRVLQNLLSNALRYTATGGVLVGVRRSGAARRIDVVDTGPGLNAQQLERAFEEFQRVGSVSPWGERGLGLGLAICQRICALLGHRLLTRSRPGRGSRFGVLIDIWQPLRPALAAAPSPAPALARQPRLALRLLCIDDDRDALDALASLLGGWGAQVDRARDEIEAVGQMARTHYDVLLADYDLDSDGEPDGLALLARLRARQTPPPKVILMTAHRGEEPHAQAQAAGVPLLHKPLHAMRLRALLESLARR